MELVEGQSPDGQAHLTEYVNLLREQVKEKDIQLETQSGHIGQLIRQLGFHQLLIQNKRVDEQFVTDGYDSGSCSGNDSGNDSGNNSIDITDALTPPVHKSFLGRIFRGRQKATR